MVIAGKRVAVINPQRVRGAHLGFRPRILPVDRTQQRLVVAVGQRTGAQQLIQLRAGRAIGALRGDGQRHPHRSRGVVHIAGASVSGFHRQEFRCGAVGEGCGAVDYRLRGRRGLRLEHIANQCAAIAGRPPYAAGDGKDEHYCHDGGDTSVTAFALSAQPVLFHQLLAHGRPLCLDRLVHHCTKPLISVYFGLSYFVRRATIHRTAHTTPNPRKLATANTMTKCKT